MLEVTLLAHDDPRRWAHLRELRGQDESAVDAAHASVATRLLERLVVGTVGAAASPGEVETLSVADRDWLIAHLHLHYFGPRIESRTACSNCNQDFEFAFSLEDLMHDVRALSDRSRGELGIEVLDEAGTFRTGSFSFRVPTVADEQALAVLPPESHASELGRRCLAVAGAEVSDVSLPALQQAVEAVAPVLSVPVTLQCAHCEASGEVDFDIVSFFLLSLLRERPLLTREVHVLASAYGWHRAEILEMPRSQRRAHVELIEAERAATLGVSE